MIISEEWDKVGGGKSIIVRGGNISDANGRVECGFEPKRFLIVNQEYATSHYVTLIYDEKVDNKTTCTLVYDRGVSQRTIQAGDQITQIDSTGFNIGYPSYWNNGKTYMLVLDSID